MSLILLTTIGKRGDGKLAADAGFAAYLPKPVRALDLRDALASLRTAQHESLITRHSLAEARGHNSSGKRRAIAANSPMPTPPPDGMRVMLVEDNPVNQRVALHMLRKLGCRVELAGTGREAVELHTHGGAFDLVLMDFQLPEMDGVAATAEIRRREGTTAHIPIVAMSASVLESDRERFRAAGMDDVLPKPMRFEDLQALIRKQQKK